MTSLNYMYYSTCNYTHTHIYVHVDKFLYYITSESDPCSYKET